MVLASEMDILATISDDEIIDTSALLSTRLMTTEKQSVVYLINNISS